MKGGKANGIAFVPTENDGFVFIDFDDVINQDNPAFLPPKISEILDDLSTLTEKSPSATGLHSMCRIKGKKPPGTSLKFKKELGIEIFLRFPVTMTGNTYKPEVYGTEIRDCTEALNKLIEKGRELKGNKEEDDFDPESVVFYKDPLTNEEIIKKLEEKYPDLWEGNWKKAGYASQSEADFALVCRIAYWTGPDLERIDTIFRESGLFREKWDEKSHFPNGDSYGEGSIKRAIKKQKRFYGENLLARITKPVEEVKTISIPPRKMIMSPWLPQASITLFVGWEGSGKTTTLLSIMDAISRGADFGPCKTENPVNCLYLDGELGLLDFKEILNRVMLTAPPQKKLFQVTSIALASDSLIDNLPEFDLFNEKFQAQLEQILDFHKIKLLTLDNLVSMKGSVNLDRLEEYGPLNRWLIKLRRKGIASILAHHPGKSGDQIGTKGKEMNVDNVVYLDRLVNKFSVHRGIRFRLKFSKARQIPPKVLKQLSEVIFELEQVGSKAKWKYESVKEDDTIKILKLLDEGYMIKEMADKKGPNYTGLSESTIYNRLKEPMKDGLVKRVKKGDHELTDKGQEYLYKKIDE